MWVSFWIPKLWYLDTPTIPKTWLVGEWKRLTSTFVTTQGRLFEVLSRWRGLENVTQVVNFDGSTWNILQDPTLKAHTEKRQLFNRLIGTFFSSFSFENEENEGSGNIQFAPKNPLGSLTARLPWKIREILWEKNYTILPQYEDIESVFRFMKLVARKYPESFDQKDIAQLLNYFPTEDDTTPPIILPIILGKHLVDSFNRDIRSREVREIERRVHGEPWKIDRWFHFETIESEEWVLTLSPDGNGIIETTVKRVEWVFVPTVKVSDGEIASFLGIHRA